MKVFFYPILLLILFARLSLGQETNSLWLAEHYTKYEHRIPMRDGVKLFTRIYVPKDTSQRWPIMLTRTPYALKPYGTDNYNSPSGSFYTFATNTFVMVTQDVRGRYGSGGEYVHVRPFNPAKNGKDTDESTDAYDTIDWLVKNVPNNNGNVGVSGISYPGFYTSMSMIDSHPALKAASPQAPISDWFIGDDIHHNGAFFLTQNFGFFYVFAEKVEDPMREESGRSTLEHLTATTFFCAWVRSPNPTLFC
jgi:putative CocE/NonD family hydrolase